jgi:hypothetical protein
MMNREGGQVMLRGASSAPKLWAAEPARPRDSNEIESWPASLLGVVFKGEKDRSEASASVRIRGAAASNVFASRLVRSDELVGPVAARRGRRTFTLTLGRSFAILDIANDPSPCSVRKV